MQLTTRGLALGLSMAASLAYLLLARWLPFPAEVVAKGLAVTMLGILALRERKSFLALALLLSSLGDVLLDLGRSCFLLGLAAFLTSHLTYVTIFMRQRSQTRPVAKQVVWPAVLALYGITFFAWLGPSLGDFRTPVFCYIAALVTMVATANRANYHSRWVFLGALLFLISDSLLGASKFKTPIPWSGFLIWISYYLGQCGIALGVLNEPAAAVAAAPSARPEIRSNPLARA